MSVNTWNFSFQTVKWIKTYAESTPVADASS